MKKIVSLMAFCVVLFGAILIVTGCGVKPEKGTVLKVIKMLADQDGNLKEPERPLYFCFHTDGKAYMASKDEEGKLMFQELGPYVNDSKSKKLTIDGDEVYSYTTSGNKMSLKDPENGKVVVELQKTRDYTEKQIKDAVGK